MKIDLEKLKTTRDFMQEKTNVFVERSDLAHILAIIIPILEDLGKQIIELEKKPKLDEIEKEFIKRGILIK